MEIYSYIWLYYSLKLIKVNHGISTSVSLPGMGVVHFLQWIWIYDTLQVTTGPDEEPPRNHIHKDTFQKVQIVYIDYLFAAAAFVHTL